MGIRHAKSGTHTHMQANHSYTQKFKLMAFTYLSVVLVCFGRGCTHMHLHATVHILRLQVGSQVSSYTM